MKIYCAKNVSEDDQIRKYDTMIRTVHNHYYTPDITDVRVGYECEIEDVLPSKNPWSSTILTQFDSKFIQGLISADNIRTLYLTKEQILSDGWDYSHRLSDSSMEHCNENFTKVFSKGYYHLNMNQSQFISISQWSIIDAKNPITRTLYNGSCPSINEFRTICKLSKIQ